MGGAPDCDTLCCARCQITAPTPTLAGMPFRNDGGLPAGRPPCSFHSTLNSFAASMPRGVLPCRAEIGLDRVRVTAGTALRWCQYLRHASFRGRIATTTALY